MARPAKRPLTDNVLAQRILQEALRLFAQAGFAATSTREIAEAAGVTKPMLYYYFQSKEGLGRAVLTRHLKAFYDRLEAVVSDRSRAPRDYLVEVVWVHLQYCREQPDFARFFYACFFGPDGRLLGLDLVEQTARGQQLLGEAVRHVARRQLVRRGSESALLLALNGMINICAITAIMRATPQTRRLAARLVDDLLRGFAPRAR